MIVILMIRDTIELEKQFLDWKIPFVAGFELLLELSFGKVMTLEQFEENAILETYDLLEEEARETYVELLANRLAPELAEKGFQELFSPCEYYNQVFFPVTSEEYLVDCGAYNGDTIKELLEVTDSFCKIYSFEINQDNCDNLNKFITTLPEKLKKRIQIYHSGVWNEHKLIGYGNEEKSTDASYSILKSSNVQEIRVDRLDDILKDEVITFIKMDIEGSELPALQGAENIIKEQKPKLAICLYHKIEDFWEIPMYIHNLLPEYHFGILHHFPRMFYGSVLYAWCK